MDRDGYDRLRTGIPVHFCENCDFGTLVAADVSGAPPIDSCEFAGVFGVCSEFIRAPGMPSAHEIEKNLVFAVVAHLPRGTPLRTWCQLRQRKDFWKFLKNLIFTRKIKVAKSVRERF